MGVNYGVVVQIGEWTHPDYAALVDPLCAAERVGKRAIYKFTERVLISY